MSRPDCIKHYRDVQASDDAHYPGSQELLSIGSPLAKATGLTRIGIHHELLLPGRRTSWPHAESDEEEFAYVIEGNPDVWIDGHLHPLGPGDAVGFPVPTGIAHTFINNTDVPVRLLVVGEASKQSNKCVYPLHAQRNEEIGDFLWRDVPVRELGRHDGRPDRLRDAAAAGATVDTPRGVPVAVTAYGAPGDVVAVLAPGRAYDMRQPLMEQCARELARAGIATMRFDWAYHTAGAQPSEDRATENEDLRTVIAAARARFGARRIILAGKSMGSCIVADVAPSVDGVAGVALLTPPLHAMNEPDTPWPRSAPMRQLECPVLIAVGDRDPVCHMPVLTRALPDFRTQPRLIVAPGGHSFAIDGGAPRTASIDAVATGLAAWARELAS